jgi:hypothetical protein
MKLMQPQTARSLHIFVFALATVFRANTPEEKRYRDVLCIQEGICKGMRALFPAAFVELLCEFTPRGFCGDQGTGTRCFSSSNQFTTMLITARVRGGI